MRESAAAIEALVVREIDRIAQAALVALPQSLRVPPLLEDRPWDYGHEGQTYPCWITFTHPPPTPRLRTAQRALVQLIRGAFFSSPGGGIWVWTVSGSHL